MPLTPEEQELFNPMKSERPECRCLRKMIKSDKSSIENLQKFKENIPPELQKKAEAGISAMMEYYQRLNQRYVDLECRTDRITLLNKRIEILQRLEDEGEATPKMVAEKMRYLSEVQTLKGGIE